MIVKKDIDNTIQYWANYFYELFTMKEIKMPIKIKS